MELRDALDQIATIRRQVARAETFRGYRALPVAFSGVLALAAALAQAAWLPDAQRPLVFLTLWLGVAVLSVLATAGELAARLRCSSALEREKTLLAVGQFAPCVVAGAVLLAVLWRFAPETLWMVPGLWAMLFSLGLFASWRFVPHGILGVAAFYLAAGATCLALAQGDATLSPWSMGVPFGVGQLLTAAVLFRHRERDDDQA